MVVMDPAGDIALQQRNLVLLSTALMLLIIIPVILMTLFIAWKYRASNTDAPYDPEWHHSTRIEVAVWAAPLAIIMVLGTVTWITCHTLDPYRPLSRLSATQPLPSGVKPLEVDVVALDWKWLFIYPELGVATVNELAAPVDRPIAFKITSNTVMNSFYVPALAGQIYAMPGMETQLHAVINKPGEYEGFSANYSGAGFSDMKFKFKGLQPAAFDQWVAGVRANAGQMDRTAFSALAQPSIAEPVRRFATVDPTLFSDILDQCATPGAVCARDVMHAASGHDPVQLAAAEKILCEPQALPAQSRPAP